MKHFILALVLGTTSIQSNAAQLYSVIEITGSYEIIHGWALNNRGHVAGQARSTGVASFPFVWELGTGIVPLATSGGASGINDEREVSGNDGGGGRYWDSTGNMVQTLLSTADAISESGVVTGRSGTNAAMWTSDGGVVVLGSFGGSWGTGWGINNFNQIVGNANEESGADQAFYWSQIAGMQSLTDLGGIHSGATSINEAGQIAGYSDTPEGDRYAVLWDQDHSVINLGGIGGTFSSAMAINDVGHVVGQGSPNAKDSAEAFLWTPEDGMLNLNGLIDPTDPFFGQITLGFATDINDAGQILAIGGFGLEPDWHTYLLSPVPIPAAVWLFGSALGLLGWMRRRR